MDVIIILERSNKHFSKFIEMLKNQEEIRQVEINQRLARSSYYVIILKRIFAINKVLREIHPLLYLAEPSFSVTNSAHVYSSIKRCPLIEIELKKEVFLVRYKHGQETSKHPNKGNKRTV